MVGSLFYMATEINDGFGGDPLLADVYRYLNSFVLNVFNN